MVPSERLIDGFQSGHFRNSRARGGGVEIGPELEAGRGQAA